MPPYYFKTMEKIKQEVRYDEGSIMQQVMIYPDEYSKIREYLSNSTDSAEDFFDRVNGIYVKEILIKIIKKGGSKKDRKIIIEDNCSGMNINPNIPFTIFRSNKKNNPKYSGNYGMGSWGGLGLCNNIHFETKTSFSNVIYSFDFTPGIFKKGKAHNMEIEINTTITDKADRSSGTTITLSDFHAGVFEALDINMFKSKIEDDIEQILTRKNISIVLIEDDKPPVKCEPFDYSKYCSNPYEKTIDTLYQTNSKKYRTKTEICIAKNPVKFFIIASENTNINKGIYLSSHGHKVTELLKVEEFRSNNKSILSRLNVAGFMDVTEVLIPTPTRKEFMKTKLSKAFFHTLNMLEPEIIKYIESASKINENGKLQLLENKINSVLQNFEENISENNTEIRGNNTSVGKEYTLLGYKIRESEKTDAPKRTLVGKPINENPPVRIKKERERNHKFAIQFPLQNSTPGLLTLKIDTINEPFKDISGNEIRSVVRDSKIIIFQKHPEFQKRLTQSLKGFYEINNRIVHYISMEVITQIKAVKNEFEFAKPESAFEEFVTSVLKLEEKLNSLVGERI